MRYYAYESGDGKVVIESNDVASGTGPVSSGGSVSNTEKEFAGVLGQLDRILPSIKQSIRDKLDDASEVKVEFGIKLAGKLGIVIASSNVEANFKISVTWT